MPTLSPGFKSSHAGRFKSSDAGRFKSSDAGHFKSSDAGRFKSSDAGRFNPRTTKGRYIHRPLGFSLSKLFSYQQNFDDLISCRGFIYAHFEINIMMVCHTIPKLYPIHHRYQRVDTPWISGVASDIISRNILFELEFISAENAIFCLNIYDCTSEL
jgi:hypothetical protein